MNKKGYLITLEGGEGSGKSSVGKELVEDLESLSLNVHFFQEPGTTEIGDKIRKILKDTANDEMSFKTEALLFQAARAQLVEEKLKPALSKSDTVIVLDRYGDSSVVYQGVARGLGIEKIRELNEFSTERLVPDLTILFDVDPEVGLKRKGKRVKEDRLDSLGLKFHSKIRQAYLSLAKEDETGRWEVVDSNKSFQKVTENIKSLVQERLRKEKLLE